MNNIIEISKKFAIDAHNSINQKYDNYSYDVHLDGAASVANRFIYLIPLEDRGNVISGVWCHDTLEDVSSITYNNLKTATNTIVAELAYACTNEKGKTRSERANAKYYEGIRNVKYARFVKLCDRIANLEYSLSVKSRMFEMYKKENIHFKSELYSIEYDDMWNYIDTLIK